MKKTQNKNMDNPVMAHGRGGGHSAFFSRPKEKAKIQRQL